MKQLSYFTTLVVSLFCVHLFSAQLVATNNIELNNIMLNDSLSVAINNGIDTMVILEGGALLSLDGNFETYLWGPNGQTGPVISANAEGYHWVTVTDATGCTATDSIYVDLVGFEPPTPPTVAINNGIDTLAILEGGALLTVDGDFVEYLWGPNGETGSVISANAEGYHWVTVTDDNGLTATDSIYVDIIEVDPPTPPTVVINNGIDTLFIQEGGALLTLDGNFAEYLWGPNGETGSVISANASGYHWVTVTDTNGLTATDSIYVDLTLVGLEDLNTAKELSVYPNPVDQVLFVKHLLPAEQKNIVAITLFNQVGQKVAQFTGAIERIDTKDLPVGNYFLRIEGDDFVWTEKIEVVH